MKEVTDMLFHLEDENYRTFTAGLIPGIGKDSIIGVRIPQMRKIARYIVREKKDREFLRELPHRYYEENQIHSFITDYGAYGFEETLELTEEFLPHIDNWAVCDSFKPAALKQNPEILLEHIYRWLESSHVYTVRSGFVLLLNWYLDERFRPEILEKAAEVRSGEYYITMGAAWFFSMALVKQYEAAVPFLEKRMLSPEVHSKTIQKAIESRQIDDKIKEYLRSLR